MPSAVELHAFAVRVAEALPVETIRESMAPRVVLATSKSRRNRDVNQILEKRRWILARRPPPAAPVARR